MSDRHAPGNASSEEIVMNTIMPEVKVPGRDEQLVWLRNELAGNRTFANLRGGKFHSTASHFIGKNPTEFCKAWDDFSAQARVMGNMLARLKRDGWDHAYGELDSALRGAHIIEGEDVPLDHTTPVTVLMFSPDVTFAMLRWGMSHKLEDVLTIKKDLAMSDEGFLRLIKGIPVLPEYLEKFDRTKHDNLLGQAYSGAIGRKALQRMNEIFGAVRDWADDQLFLRLNRSLSTDHYLLEDNQLYGYLFVGKEQGDILSRFSREEQENLATWTIDYPTSCLRDLMCVPKGKLWIGFHEEVDHSLYAKAPFFPSRSVLHGMGATLITDNDQLSRFPSNGRKSRYPIVGPQDKEWDGKWRVAFKICSCFDDGCTR